MEYFSDRSMNPEEPPDPYKELMKNIDLISPVKRCPKCKALALVFDEKNHRIYCRKCGFEKKLPQMKE